MPYETRQRISQSTTGCNSPTCRSTQEALQIWPSSQFAGRGDFDCALPHPMGCLGWSLFVESGWGPGAWIITTR
jgi:hypothetical protein